MTFNDSLAMQLRRTYMTMHRYAQSHFAPFGVTVDQYVVLCVLEEEDGIRQQDLAERACSDANTIAAMLNLLEEKKLVRRRPDKTDGRARLVCLTPQGCRIHQRLLESVGPIHTAMEQAIGKNREGFLKRLQAIEATAASFRDQDALAG